MGIERLISLESGTLLELDGYGGSVIISTAAARTGVRSLQIPNHSVNGTHWAAIKVAPRDEYYIQLAIRPTNINISENNPYIRITGPDEVTVATLVIPGGTMLLKAYLGNSSTYVGDIGSLSVNAWNVLQLRLRLHSSTGVFQAKLGGDLTLDYQGNTIVTSATTFGTLRINNLLGGGDTYYDDIIIHNTLGTRNNSWPNGARLYRLVPNGAGTHTQWTPSAGSNWDCLEEVPPSLSDFVRPTAVDQTDTYAISNLPSEIVQVSGVVLEYWGETIGSPTVNAVKPVIRLGSTDHVGDALTLPPVFSPKQVAYDQAPNGQAWTVSMVNDMEVGQRSASA